MSGQNMYNTNPTEARREALRNTRGDSLVILQTAFPDLVACPAPSGDVRAICYRDLHVTGPISCTWQEATILGLLAKSSKATRALEIGSAAGWSTAHIARFVPITCIDPFIETASGLVYPTNHEAEARFLDNMSRMGFDEGRVNLSISRSPDSIRDLAGDTKWDFVFIDGWHLDGQPLQDVRGALPYVSESGLICLHDINMPDVASAGAYLAENGWTMTKFDTACRLSVFWKGNEPKWWIKFCRQIVDALVIA